MQTLSETPKVSVIIPTHQRADMVIEAIESVLSQSYQDYEIIVVDDSSTDGTKENLEPYIKQNNLSYYYIEVRSVALARNHAIKHAKGEYIAFLDDDDLWPPNKLETQIAWMEKHPETGLIHGGFSKFDDDGTNLGYRDTSRFSENIYPGLLLEWSVLIMISTVMVRVGVFDKVGLFDQNLARVEDIDMWIRIARHYPVHAITDELAKVRVHPGSISSDTSIRISAFHPLMLKAFENDPDLSRIFKQRALAKMYANTAKNLLADGKTEQMILVRKISIQSYISWPLQLEAFLIIIASLLNSKTRQWLYKLWYQYRYKPRNI